MSLRVNEKRPLCGLSIPLEESVSLALETNGKGYIGFIIELPGSFVRGRTEVEALGKVNREVKAYGRWLGEEPPGTYSGKVVQRHESSLMVEDADHEILLDSDREAMTEEES